VALKFYLVPNFRFILARLRFTQVLFGTDTLILYQIVAWRWHICYPSVTWHWNINFTSTFYVALAR